MSGRVVGHVIRNSRHSGTALLVLVVIAEAARADGTGAWPSVATIARGARTSDRHVRRILADLVLSGELVIDHGSGPHGTNRYTINGVVGQQLQLLAPLTPGSGGRRRQADNELAEGLTSAAKGDDTARSANPSSRNRPSDPSSRARGPGDVDGVDNRRGADRSRDLRRRTGRSRAGGLAHIGEAIDRLGVRPASGA